jgi:hypothetical protein
MAYGSGGVNKKDSTAALSWKKLRIAAASIEVLEVNDIFNFNKELFMPS